MSKLRIVGILAAGGLLLTLASARAATADLPGGEIMGASIVGSAHDIPAKWGISGPNGDTEICVFCHTPHNAAKGTDQIIPLWNHATSSKAGSFTLYSSATLKATPTQPVGNSLACLSCHDGVTAIDSYDAYVSSPTAGTTLMGTLMEGADHSVGSGGNISNSHPVSFKYDSALASADAGVVAPTGNTVGKVKQLPLFTIAGGSGYNLECATCHNPHDPTNDNFLRMDNTVASALCLNCHNK